MGSVSEKDSIHWEEAYLEGFAKVSVANERFGATRLLLGYYRNFLILYGLKIQVKTNSIIFLQWIVYWKTATSALVAYISMSLHSTKCVLVFYSYRLVNVKHALMMHWNIRSCAHIKLLLFYFILIINYYYYFIY